jgi:hypothetical protein
MRERQLESIADANARRVYQGRRPTIDTARVKALKAQGMGAFAIAKTLGSAARRLSRSRNESSGVGGEYEVLVDTNLHWRRTGNWRLGAGIGVGNRGRGWTQSLW